MPKSFEGFTSARIVMDATEVFQSVSSDMNCQSLSAVRVNKLWRLRYVVPNGGLVVFFSELYTGWTFDSAIVDHCVVLNQLHAGEWILADKGLNIFDKLPSFNFYFDEWINRYGNYLVTNLIYMYFRGSTNFVK